MNSYPTFIFWVLSVMAFVIADYLLDKDSASRAGWGVVFGWFALLGIFVYATN